MPSNIAPALGVAGQVRLVAGRLGGRLAGKIQG